VDKPLNMIKRINPFPKILSIVKGWYLLITDNRASRVMYDSRMPTCNTCQNRNKALNTCKLCGCFLPAKTRVIEEECPANYW